MSLLQVNNLIVEFPGRRGTLRALDDISFDIAPGEILGVVGESGAGKSLTGASIRSCWKAGASTTCRPSRCAISAAARSARSSRIR
jgi:ABC-type glutathione transport system ATPase component